MKPKRKRHSEVKIDFNIDNGCSDPEFEKEIKTLFEKQFKYTKPSNQGWYLPNKDTWFVESWTDDELLVKCEKLNEIKSSLSQYDIQRWHQHTSSTNFAGSVMQHLRKYYNPELCTQAWAKFYEILVTYSMITDKTKDLFSVHLCEAPGAFIASLNHYLKSTDFEGIWHWLASTLNPHYEGNDPGEAIIDDRFIKDTMKCWYFGVDNTGNLINITNIKALKEESLKKGAVNLVTADGSIDCTDCPNDQEKVTAKLHFSEVVSALSLLSIGGVFVMKMFTMFEDSSISLMFLLNCLFKEVNVFKPATSKSGNSEVYVICKSFIGISENNLMSLISYVETEFSYSLFSKSTIPESFLNQHRKCCNLFADLQTHTIESNLIQFKNDFKDKKRIDMKRSCTAYYYVELFGVMKIETSNYVFPHHKYTSSDGAVIKRHSQSGSFDERMARRSLSWEQKVDGMDVHSIDNFEANSSYLQNSMEWNEKHIKDWKLIYGHPFDKILSSQFATIEVLREWSVLVNHSPKIMVKSYPISFDHLRPAFDHILAFSCKSEESPLQLVVLDQQIPEQLINVVSTYGNQIKVISSKKESDLSRATVYFAQGKMANLTCGMEEISSKREITQIMKKSFEAFEAGDSVILQFQGALTRFSAGFIYLLYRSFKMVKVILSDDDNPVLFVVGIIFSRKVNKLVNFLDKIDKNLKQISNANLEPLEIDKNLKIVSEPKHELLQFIPMNQLNDLDLINYLEEINDNQLKKRINFLISEQKARLNDGVVA